MQTFNYYITTNPDEMDDGWPVSEAMAMVISAIYERVMAMDPHVVRDLKRLIKANPSVPVLRNLLTNYYRFRDDLEKAYEINRETLELFPDHVFTKVNLVHEYIDKGQLEKVEGVLGHHLEISDMLPKRKTFHISEVLAYSQAVIRYFISTKDFILAENRIETFYTLLEKFPDSQRNNISSLEDDLKFAKIRAGIPVEDIPIPKLSNPLLLELYCNSMRINQGLIEKILLLPHKSILQDLEIILRNCLDNFFEYTQLPPDSRLSEHPIHALFLIAEIGDEDSLPILLEVLSWPDEVLHFWFNDFLTEEYWKILLKVVGKNTDELLKFILKPGIDPYARSVISQMMGQLALLKPQRRPEIIEWFRILLNEINTNPEFLNDIEAVPADLYLGDLEEIKALELEQEMIATHNLYLSERDQMFGGLELMIQFLHNKERIAIPPDPFPDIYSMYNQYLLEWDFYTSERDLEEIELIRNPDLNEMDEDEDDLYDEEDEDEIYDEWSEVDSKNDLAPHTIVGTKEPGRNEPCPCGSGKKYKKCCMLN
jgi:hypothetical protein